MKDLPEGERPRERLFAHGPEALADRELLALLLSSGTAGADAIELAARLISKHGSLQALSKADPHDLEALPGMGLAKAARVVAAFHLARRSDREPARRRITCSGDLASVAAPMLRGLRHERVVVIACDAAGTILRTVMLTEGGTDRSLVPVRDVLTIVLAAGGASFGVLHNHPSGNLKPSESDRRVTAELYEGASTVGLRLLDHVIVTDTAWRRVTVDH